MSLHYTCAPPITCNLSPALRRPIAPLKHPAGFRCRRLPPRIRCQAPLRRSADYQPNLWSHDFIQSLTDDHRERDEEDKTRRINILKENVRKLIYQKKKQEDQLELIDQLQQLGVAYHFRDDIKDALGSIYGSLNDVCILLKDNLYATSLLFRLLRENNFAISADIFDKFKDEKGYFKSCPQQQIKGMLSLYEASYLAKEKEVVLNEAMDFTTNHLKRLMEGSLQPCLKEPVAHALELPLNWRMQRVHTRWFLEACQKDITMNPVLLELAKLDFNAVQSLYKRELGEVSRWWTDLGLAQQLPFCRDRLVENYLWAVGFGFEPQLRGFREMQAKIICFITMIDDVYDVYGTLEEIELFTDAVDRWDVSAMDKLPEYMKMCFLAVFNTTNDAAYKVMKEKGLDIIPYLKRAWAEQCKSYLVEAKWYHQGHTPKLDEYLDNAWISIAGPLVLTHACCTSKDLTQEALQSFCINYPAIVRPASVLLRLYDDLGTSTDELEKGDVPKSIQCCMRERNVSEAVARGQIGDLIMANWRALNAERTCTTTFDEHFKNVAINVPRMAQFFYGHGDGYGKPDKETKNQIISLFIEPIMF